MATTGDRGQSLPTIVRELGTMVVAYVRQQTVEPLKGVGRSLALGLAGVVVGSIGGVFLLLGGIRVLQTETTAFSGNLSFLPYVFALVLCAAVAGGAARSISAGGDRGRDR